MLYHKFREIKLLGQNECQKLADKNYEATLYREAFAKTRENRYLESVMWLSTQKQSNEGLELARELWIPEAWIIEKERRKKQDKENRERPCLQLPVPEFEPLAEEEADESQAGSTVVIIDL